MEEPVELLPDEPEPLPEVAEAPEVEASDEAAPDKEPDTTESEDNLPEDF